MFVGRKRELSILRDHYSSQRFECVGIYGRRRVGKTSLISEFVRDLPCGYYTAIEDDASANLRLLSQAIYSMQHPDADIDIAPVYPDFQTALEAAFAYARNKRCVLVVDELPYLARSYTAFPSILQAVIDRNQGESGLFLVLCGSSLSFMKDQLLDRNSPLYGRRTAQIELKPFDFFESFDFFTNTSAYDVANLYGMVGGVPLYLQQYRDGDSLENNVQRMFLEPSALLYEEPTNLLKQEVSKAGPYNAVLAAIADGASRHNQIASKVGINRGGLDYYLKELVRLGLVDREEPITGDGRRRAVWRIADPLFLFWYKYIRPRQTLIERGLGHRVTNRILASLPNHMDPVFERICRDWLWCQLAQGSLEFEFTAVGRWWGNGPKARSQAEIDIVALDEKRTAMVAECKWRGEQTSADQLLKLDARASLANGDATTLRWMFSQSGFTAGCEELASSMGARLITFDQMLL